MKKKAVIEIANLARINHENVALREELRVLEEEKYGSTVLIKIDKGEIPNLLFKNLKPTVIDSIKAKILLKGKNPNLKIFKLIDDKNELLETLIAESSFYLLQVVNSHLIENEKIDVLEGVLPPTSISNIRKSEIKVQTSHTPETEKLSKREQEVLQWLKKGMAVREISEKMFISDKTVRKHLEHIYEKLQVHSGKEAIVKVIGKRDETDL